MAKLITSAKINGQDVEVVSIKDGFSIYSSKQKVFIVDNESDEVISTISILKKYIEMGLVHERDISLKVE